MSLFKLFVASILLTTTVYGLDPVGYDVSYGDAFLLFPFKQQECANPSAEFASEIKNSTSSGFDTLVMNSISNTTFSCPSKGNFQNAANGVIIPNDVNDENAGVMSTGTLGDSGFVNSICLQTTTDGNGKEVCEDENIQFAVEFWFDYQTGVTFPDPNPQFVFLEISDASEVFFQIAYQAGAEQFQISWNNGLAVIAFTEFKEGLNHVVFRIEGTTQITYSRVIVNGGALNEAAAVISPSTASFTSNAKLRIGDGITDSNFKTAIHHLALFKRDAYDETVFTNFASDLFERGVSNSYPVTNAKRMFVTILEDEADSNIATKLKSPNNIFDFDDDEIVLKLLSLPTNGYLGGTNGTTKVDEEFSTANEIIFHSDTPRDFFNIEKPNDCTATSSYSSFEVQVGDEYGSFDSDPVNVYICILQVDDPFVLKSNATQRVSYNGQPQQIALDYLLVDGSEEDYTVSITSSDDVKLTLFADTGCTEDVIPIDIASRLAEASPNIQGNVISKYATFEFCIQPDHEEGGTFSSESALLNWKISSKSAADENTEDFVRVELKNPISTCISDSDCKVETTENTVTFIGEIDVTNTNASTTTNGTHSQSKFEVARFSIPLQAPIIGGGNSTDNSTDNSTNVEAYYFTVESVPSDGNIYRSFPGPEMKVGDRIGLSSSSYGRSMDIFYVPNDDYFNRWNGSFENILNETFHGCADPVSGCPDVATFLALQSEGEFIPSRATVEFFVEATTSYPLESDFKALVDSVEVVADEFTPLVNGGVAVIQFNDRDHDTTMKALEIVYSTGELRIDESLFEENADILFSENCDTRVSNTTLPQSLAQNNATFPDSNATLPNNNNTTTPDNNSTTSGCMVFASGVPSMLNSLLETLEFKTGESTTVTFTILSLDKREEVSTSLDLVIRDDSVTPTPPPTSTPTDGETQSPASSTDSLSDGEIGAIVSVSTIAIIVVLVTGYRMFTNSDKETLAIREAVDQKEDLANFL